MADNPDIIKSKILSSDHDIFWKENVSAGDLQRPMLVISAPYQPGGAEEQQLLKMLQACALSSDSYKVIQLEQDKQASWHIIRDKVQPEFVLMLGISAQQLGISAMLRFNEPNRFNDCIFIPTLALQELDRQAEVKKNLWLNALKPVFVDKTFQNKQ